MELLNAGRLNRDAFMPERSKENEEDRKSDSPAHLQPSLQGVAGTIHLDENHRQPRKRGRPKMDIGREAYSDRRKTQLRIAQRAYRSRKEDTILSLKRRIDQLEASLEKMNETFLSFSDELIRSNTLRLYPNLARAFHRTTKQCISITNEAMSVMESDCSNEKTNSAEIATPDLRNSADKIATHSLYWDVHLQRFQRVNEIQTTFPALEPLRDTAPVTSGPEELNFVYRLRLACVEYGYQCLRNPDYSEAIAQRFDLSLRMVTLQDIIAYFEALLKRGSHPYSEDLNIPFYSVGGAGTHYVHHKRTYSAKAANRRAAMSGITAQQASHDAGGDWFDCYDVEEFLKENNVTLVRGVLPPDFSSHSYGRTQNRYLSETESSNRYPYRNLVNESALIDFLTRCCVCLGCAPGFPRSSIEDFVIENTIRC